MQKLVVDDCGMSATKTWGI